MDYLKEFKGRFIGIMDWDECNLILEKLTNNPNNWYLYDVSKKVPIDTFNANDFIDKINFIKNIITNKHKERYCGIVYVDNQKNPNFIKVFHPDNLGKVCGGSDNPPLPQWLISKTKPIEITKKDKKPSFISKFLM